METHLYIEVDNCSPKVTEKRYGYVNEAPKITAKKNTKEYFGKIEGTYHQATLIAMAEALKKYKEPCEIYIHTKNVFVLQMLEENLERWYQEGFVTASNKPVANQEIWKEIYKEIQPHLVMTVPGVHPFSNWILREIEQRKKDEKDEN